MTAHPSSYSGSPKNILWVALMGTEDYNNIALSYLPCILQFAKHLNVIFLIISPVR